MQFEAAKSFILAQLRAGLSEHLTYHSVAHVMDVYAACKAIAAAEGVTGEDLLLLKTAALFHDAGFLVQQKDHEQLGCDFARKHLPRFGYSGEDIDRVCGAIMATRIPQQPGNLLEEILADADLDYLGRDDFKPIGDMLLAELRWSGANLNPLAWDKLQIGFLESHRYFTPTANRTRAAGKAAHLAALKARVAAAERA